MYKRIVLMVLMLVTLSSFALANDPMLVLDSSDKQLPASFRTTNDDWKHQTDTQPSRDGLANLHSSGSAQFSAAQLVAMLPHMSSHIIIVDLREECHGFINWQAVSWYGDKNSANRGKSLDEVLTEEASRLDGIMNSKSAVLKHKKGNMLASIDVQDVMVESRLAEINRLGYFRINAPDHISPSNDNIDRFVQFVKALPNDTWLHFHCRAGHGRTTTFMVLYDIMRNGKQVSLADIAKRQYLLGGIDVLTSPPAKDSWKRDAYIERAKLIQDFYTYITTSPDDLPITWSEWIKSKN